MSASTTAMTSSTSAYTTPAFWERLWRAAGIQSLFCFIGGYVIYGQQPQIGASPDALAAFYGGAGTRILIAAVFYGLAILNLMWFAAAIKTTLTDAGQDGWAAAATASNAALGGLFLLLTALFAAGVSGVVLILLGGTTWLSGGLWAPDGVYSRFVSPAIGVVWGMVVSGVLLRRSPATRGAW